MAFALLPTTIEEARELLAGPTRAALIREMAEAGIAPAQVALAEMLIEAGEARAGFGWLLRAVAQGEADALAVVGRCYADGIGVVRDMDRAARCWRAGAAAGSAAAEALLGRVHEARDVLAAAQCYKRAAAQGDGRGCFDHARMLARKGRVREALGWIARAARAGDARVRAELRGWLEVHGDAELRLRGLRALDGC